MKKRSFVLNGLSIVLTEEHPVEITSHALIVPVAAGSHAPLGALYNAIKATAGQKVYGRALGSIAHGGVVIAEGPNDSNWAFGDVLFVGDDGHASLQKLTERILRRANRADGDYASLTIPFMREHTVSDFLDAPARHGALGCLAKEMVEGIKEFAHAKRTPTIQQVSLAIPDWLNLFATFVFDLERMEGRLY